MRLFERRERRLVFNIPGQTPTTFMGPGHLLLPDSSIRIDRLDAGSVELTLLPPMTAEEAGADVERLVREKYGLPAGLGGAP